jgi:hypothetical protein
MLQKKYQPQLRKGIKIAVDLVNSVKQDEKDGDVDIKVRIAPNTFEITSEIIFEGNSAKECKVESISEIDNNTKNTEKFWALMKIWRKALGIGEDIQNLSDDNRDLVSNIREKDSVWSPTQGFIYVPLIEGHQEAVKKLSEESKNSIAILGTERGGAMVADQIPHDNKVIVEHQFIKNEEGKTVRSKSLETRTLLARLREIAVANRGTAVTVSIAETVVGGGSAEGLIKELNESNILEQFPNLTVKLLLLQQTMHSSENAREAESKISKKVDPDFNEMDREGGIVKKMQTRTGKLQVVLSKTPYILGEDVGYQLKRQGKDSKQPVILFNINDSQLKLKRITPQQDTTARDILLMLTQGELDNHINDMR